MKYREDPISGNILSVLGYGCMRFPRKPTGKFDKVKTEPLVMDAIEKGINYFDTAYVYGDSEQTLGEILAKNGVRSNVYIATKLPHHKVSSLADAEKIFSEELSRLQTDYIDYYLIHNLPDMNSWQRLVDMGIEGWIKDKQASGKIRSIGFSFHGRQADFLELLDAYAWEFVQIQYNYLNVNYQAGMIGLKAAHAKGLPVIIMEPLLGGKLATQIPGKVASLFESVAPGRSAATWAMRWLYDQEEVSVVLSGMGAADQIEDNVRCADEALPGMLSPEEKAVYPQAEQIFKESYKVDCTGCNYCMPCPAGVNIPGCFSAYNMSYTMGFVSGVTQYFTSTGLGRKGANFSVKNCTHCRLCETKCPQHIHIHEELGKVRKRMEPWWMGAVIRLVRKFF